MSSEPNPIEEGALLVDVYLDRYLGWNLDGKGETNSERRRPELRVEPDAGLSLQDACLGVTLLAITYCHTVITHKPAAVNTICKGMAGHKWTGIIDRTDGVLLSYVHKDLGRVLHWLKSNRSFFFHPHFCKMTESPVSNIPLRTRLFGLALMTMEGVFAINENGLLDFQENGQQRAEALLSHRAAWAASELRTLIDSCGWRREIVAVGKFLCQEKTLETILALEPEFLCTGLDLREKEAVCVSEYASQLPRAVKEFGKKSREALVATAPYPKDNRVYAAVGNLIIDPLDMMCSLSPSKKDAEEALKEAANLQM
ncbi:hypothetical protein GNI_115370 [Gregarina niphandrodes]|uniref:Uncharacterized protein n=1 Tax=Gregarina niphandrodes TaxID=110365 RepID=A0A023B2X3_GRENI|nr:hypothetical protein GNI_115370 [Gregarina niphandrodes]EZG55263.1 hypothetical protein GNI_115370 [Gregarina niphandrodes]|eukprot:XP_011131678.1 hypothetical protein GNI_115370 [Gregarina niphandrodes]